MKPVIGVPLRYQKLNDDRAIIYISERVVIVLKKRHKCSCIQNMNAI